MDGNSRANHRLHAKVTRRRRGANYQFVPPIHGHEPYRRGRHAR
jgi:hypothetical protein